MIGKEMPRAVCQPSRGTQNNIDQRHSINTIHTYLGQAILARPIDVALKYAREGLEIFPCCPDTKRPLTSHGFKDATTDEETIINWWKQHPEAMIGWPTAGFLVLDVDQPKGVFA